MEIVVLILIVVLALSGTKKCSLSVTGTSLFAHGKGFAVIFR